MKKKIRPYKRTLPLLLGCLLAFVLFGCGGEDSGGTEEDSLLQDVMEGEESGAGGSQAGESGGAGVAADEQADSETADGIRGQVSRVSEQQTKNTDNMLLLRNRSQSVSVVIPDNQEAEEAVNGFFADRRLSYGDTVAQYREAALATMAASRPEQEAEDGNGACIWYEYDVRGNKTKEEQVISEDVTKTICFRYDRAGRLSEKKELIAGWAGEGFEKSVRAAVTIYKSGAENFYTKDDIIKMLDKNHTIR